MIGLINRERDKWQLCVNDSIRWWVILQDTCMFRGQLDGKGSFIIIVIIIFNSILDFNGSFSESNFHPVATARDAHLTGRHIRKAVAAEAKFYHLVAEIGVETTFLKFQLIKIKYQLNNKIKNLSNQLKLKINQLIHWNLIFLIDRN